MALYVRYVPLSLAGGGSGGTGTVTSVGLADDSTHPIYTIGGSPVTTAGTLTLTLSNQSANTVFAGPTSGSSAQPAFRSLVAADLPTGNLTDSGVDGITITNGTGAVIGSGTSISQQVATTSTNGYLSSTDWNTFNNKQASGNYITALTGDGTASGPGSAVLTLSTVNSNVGSYSPAAITVNAKGLITAASSVTTGNFTNTGSDGITITGGTGAVLGTGTTLSQQASSGSTNGYLSSTDWTTFNNKQSTLTLGNLTTSSSHFSVSGGTGAVVGSGTTLTLTEGNLTEATSSVLSITGGTSSVLGSGTTIQVLQAGTSQSGYLSSTDWNTFNNKQASGNYITALTGDVTASGPGSVAATLATVNSNVGSYTNASITVNAKGLITAASSGTAPVTSISVASSNGFAGTSSGGSTPALTLSTTITGILQGNGTAISAATTTGSGSVVLSTSPTLTTPALGTPSAAVLTNATGLPLTSGVTGVLPIANGGTDNGSLAVTAGGLIYTDGTKFQNVGAGTSGYVLQSNGSSAPTWVSSSLPSTTAANYTTATAGSYSDGTSTVINYGTKVFDEANAVTTGSSWIYTAPSSGIYFVQAAIVTDSNGSTGNCALMLYKNTSANVAVLSKSFGTGSSRFCLNGSTLISLSSGDTVSIQFNNSSGSTRSFDASATENYVSIYRVSA